ncbi:hypothetical protein FPOA_06459 [Fusarium poae]|uniref:chitinase n=1 Tax=Fusarium poae TaxID=36050 RepID=A0A1B8AZS8_FUSPO|nr:hypothetical protein FPOA_06459 [Fusarium poae]
MHIRIWLLGLLLMCLCISVAAQNDDTTCSATKRCKNGCCNKSGNCGFGPDYCGTNCQSDCDRKSECNPGFGAKWAENEKCPLNVCCSKHGYCGTTKDFCGSKKVKRPSCSKDGEVSRVIGYFEGWARTRPCEAFSPEQIPIGLYTHINFAFASIDPKTFEIKPDKESDVRMYERLTELKRLDPELKIYIAVGGWTFNDPGPTASTFSQLAASLPRQRAFMASLMSFMSTYGFDGLDLDWEYPGDPDRGGQAVDFVNFPKFMDRLKKMMDSADKGLSITLPASYWYLKQFDIKKLEKSVDFFNIMSYDLHGAWDHGKNYTQPLLNAHSNLTEIDLALDLLWRNNIQSDKVVLGMGFYGRAFSVQSGTCTEPGCLFKAAGKAGECSREKGILLNSEIVTTLKKHNVKSQLFKEEAVKIAKWGNQWVSYDDEDTFPLKTEYANSRCLGGVMVWAISHDTKEARFNTALALSLKREVTPGIIDWNEKAYEIKKIPNEQCRWSSCKEGCPKGWVRVARSDKHARKGEVMFDETGCGGDGGHTFCCPGGSSKLPTCGWYGHRDGNCAKSSQCPSNMWEIGSNEIYCDPAQSFQTACCTTDVVSTKVYRTCGWGQYPKCDDQEGCPNPQGDSKMSSLMFSSASGSGGGVCNLRVNDRGLPIPSYQTRKFCCNDSDKNLRFTDCKSFTDIGPGPTIEPAGFCRSGCPSDRIQVAIDTRIDKCSEAGIGGMAHCCKTDYAETFEWENPKLDSFRTDVYAWLKDPTCPKTEKSLLRRAALPDDGLNNVSSTTDLVPRAGKGVENEHPLSSDLGVNLARLILGTFAREILEEMTGTWNEAVTAIGFSFLTVTLLGALKRSTPEWENDDTEVMARYIVCNPREANIRSAAIQAPQESEVTVEDDDGNEATFEYEVPAHPPPKTLDDLSEEPPYAVLFANRADCNEISIIGKFYDVEALEMVNVHTEHLLDKSVMKLFMTEAAQGRLTSGARSMYGPIPIGFFEEIIRLGEDDEGDSYARISGNPHFRDGNLWNRIFECLGSYENIENFMITYADINLVKGQLMQLNEPVSLVSITQQLQEDALDVLKRIRAALAFFDYMNMEEDLPYNGADPKGKLNNIINEVIRQFISAEVLYERHHGERVNIAQFFREWFIDYCQVVTSRALVWLPKALRAVEKFYEGDTSKAADSAREFVEVCRGRLQRTTEIETDWDIPLLDGDEENDDEDVDMGGT